jgi:uncharacterized delta-60 repeat protein
VVVYAQHEAPASACVVDVFRFTAAGDLDSNFALFESNLRGAYCGSAIAMAIMPGDKVAIDALWNISDGSQQLVVDVLDPTGAQDSTFGGPLTIASPVASRPSIFASSLLVDKNGNFVVTGANCAGGWSVAASNCTSMVLRLTPAGALDTTFGVAGTSGKIGMQYTQLGTAMAGQPVESFNSAAFDSDGNILVVGRDEQALHGTFGRVLAADGSFDPAFGNGGTLTHDVITGATYVDLEGVGQEADGSVRAMGVAEYGGNYFVTRTKLTSTGMVDATYGVMGTASTQVNYSNGVGLLLPDGREVMVAIEVGGGGDVAGVLRFWP